MSEPDHEPGKVNIALQRAIEALLVGERPVAYHAALARALGSATAGVLLSQLLYWTPRSRNLEGWIWKTREEIAQETALSRYEQETARRILVKAGVVEERRAGVPARMHFRVNLNAVVQLLAAQREAPPQATGRSNESPDGFQLAENQPTGWVESNQLVGGSAANKSGARPPAITETTPETSTENTTETTNFSRKKQTVNISYSNPERGTGETTELVPNSELVDNDTAANIPLASVSRDASSQLYFTDRKGTTSKTTDAAGPRGLRPVGETLAQRAADQLKHASQSRQKAQKSAPGGPPGLPDHATPGSINSAPRKRGRPRKIRADYLEAVIADFSREFHDEEHLPSNLSQAKHLLQASGMEEERFVQSVVYPARSIVREQGNIRKHYGDGTPLRNKMPYFFACVRDALGIREDAGGPVPPIHQGPPLTRQSGRPEEPT